jgi:hypothetical protein
MESWEISKLSELKENKNIPYQNLWDTAKTVSRGKLIALNIYIGEKWKSQMSDISTRN